MASAYKKRRARRLLGLCALLIAALLAYSTWRLAAILRAEAESAAYYDGLRAGETAVRIEAGPGAETDAQPGAEPGGGGASEKDFAALRAVNPDVVGWLTCPGTVIDYPVVQGDDNIYYLTRLFNGETNKAGTLFLDCHNAPDFMDGNSVIYGHHMKNGSMLAGIVGYKEQAYYDAHPAMELFTPAGDYLVELFSGYVARDEAVLTAPHFADDAAFGECIAEANAASTFKCAVDVQPSDRILTLVTCTYEVENARYVLHGRVVFAGAD